MLNYPTPRPVTVCPKCKGWMERKMVIKESTGHRHLGDDKPFFSLGSGDIMSYICMDCGNVSAYQAVDDAYPKTKS